MKRALRALLAVAVLTGVLLVAVLFAAVQPEPAVSLREEVTHQDVARVLNLLRWHDPRRATPGRQSVATLHERDLEVLLGHAAQRWLHGAGRVGVHRGGATLTLSAHLPPNPLGRWLNVELQLLQTGGLPVIDSVRVGRLPVPALLAQRLVEALVQRAGLGEEIKLAAEVVHQVRFMPQRVAVRYAWQSDSPARMLAALVPADDQQRLRAYAEHLARLAERAKPAWDAPLPALIGPLFELASARSAAGGDAAAENRAALIVLTLYANGRGVDAMVPAAKAWARPRLLRLTLAGRQDFVLHFLVSAALAAEGSGPLSQAIGLYKEVADSRGGSGFSFTDMAANRAGTRFGQNLVADPLRMQELLARKLLDTDLVPAFADLPQFMPEAEFVQRFGGVGAPAYNELLAEIDRRIAALALLR